MNIDQQHPLPVELPSADLIRAEDLAVGIAKAVYPVKTEGLMGIDCITGKRPR